MEALPMSAVWTKILNERRIHYPTISASYTRRDRVGLRWYSRGTRMLSRGNAAPYEIRNLEMYIEEVIAATFLQLRATQTRRHR